MYSIKQILTAASLAVLAAGGRLRGQRRRPGTIIGTIAARSCVTTPISTTGPSWCASASSTRCACITIAASATPVFLRGHYVVKSFNRFGHVVFVEVNPYTGDFLGEFRI